MDILRVAFASKYSGRLTCSSEDAAKLKAWQAFLKSKFGDADAIVSRISLYNLTGEPPQFFLGASMNIPRFDERICDQLRIAAENWMLLMACGELGDLSKFKSEEENSRTLAPAATLKAYMDNYKLEESFLDWDLDRMVDVGAKIYKVVDVFRSKIECHENSERKQFPSQRLLHQKKLKFILLTPCSGYIATKEVSPLRTPPRYGLGEGPAKRARVIEESDEDDNTPLAPVRRLGQLREFQLQKREIKRLKEENTNLKTNLIDSKEMDSLKEEIAKLQATNHELMKANKSSDSKQTTETRRRSDLFSSRSSPIEIHDDPPPTTLTGQALALEKRLEIAKERVTAEFQLIKEAKSRYENAKAEYAKLSNKRE